MTSDASDDDAAVGWPFPAAINISAPSWQSDLTRQGQVPLIRPRIQIGNDAACEIVLLDSGIARRHAAISWTADGYQIEDLGSVNGTWVDGKRIFKPTPLVLGTSIRIGGATLLVATPRGEQTTMAPSAAPTHVAPPTAPAAPAAPTPVMNLGTPLRTAGEPPADVVPTTAPSTDAVPVADEVAAADASPEDAQETPLPAQRPATVPVRTPTPPPAAAQAAYALPQSPLQPQQDAPRIMRTSLPQQAHPTPVTPMQQPSAAPVQVAAPTAMQPQPMYAPQQPVLPPRPITQPNGFVPQTPLQQPAQPPMQMQAPGSAAVPGQRFDFNKWLVEQQPLFYWKFFLIGLVVLIVAEFFANNAQNPIAIPDIILIYAGLVPVTFVIFFWEQGAEVAQISPIVIVSAFGCGATVGLILGSTLDGILQANANTLFYALLIGVAEESGKVGALYYFMRDTRLRKEIHGLLLGAACGMGFAALETSGYGFVAFIQGLQQGGTFGAALDAANQQLLSRMLLAIFGHGVWTAIVCSAIWRERGNQTFALTRGVIIAFLIAIGLHGLWDFSIGQSWLPITIGNGAYPGFDILVVGPLGLIILSFFLREAIEQARRGPNAPPPPPLDDALKAYFSAIIARFSGSRPAPAAQPYGTPIASYPPQAPQPYPPQGPQASPYPPQGPQDIINAAPPQPRQQPQPQRQQPPAYPAAYPPPNAAQGQGQVLPPPPAAAPHWPLPSREQPPQQPIWPLPTAQAQQPKAPFAEAHPLAHVPYCARCGITYPPGATLCTNCGSPLTEEMGR